MSPQLRDKGDSSHPARSVLACIALVMLGARFVSAADDLHEAARVGDLQEVMRLCRERPELVSAQDAEGRTALREALVYRQMTAARVIWAYTPKDDVSAAAALGDLDALRMVLRVRPQSANERDERGNTPLHWAAREGQVKAAELLLDEGARHVPDRWGRMPLHVAAEWGRKACVQLLLARGADVNAPSAESESSGRWWAGTTPLTSAVWSGHYETVRLLLAKGANPNAADELGRTPLHSAAGGGDEAMVVLLLRSGADLNARAEDGETPLRGAVDADELAVARLLLARGARHDIFSAAALGDAEAVRGLLKERGAVVAERDCGEQTPLFWAASRGHSEVVRLLLGAGAAVDARDERGMTPLHRATISSQPAVVEELLAGGADVDAEALQWDNKTALIHATELGNVGIVRILLDHGASIDAADADGARALDRAAEGGMRDVVALLVARGADVKAAPRGRLTPLELAAKRGHLSTVKVLLDRGGDDYSRAVWEGSALQLAREGGHKAVVRLLESRKRVARGR